MWKGSIQQCRNFICGVEISKREFQAKFEGLENDGNFIV